jgi:hypothetical protein
MNSFHHGWTCQRKGYGPHINPYRGLRGWLFAAGYTAAYLFR